ncbi:MAG: hypothetical protein A2X56_00145 [Nitrospirae bacterium GWC2_57_13]|nr:MAG: hypothetical protein A2072_07095 [Nitrospirae bacterium GWC1_57_7]OGW28405.1 MAG: hypothetical protein A2X56_00145 [Nitrospirae bacterium GWC2_57_13]HAR45890.1 radical SAM protein [Nitrospiraceae bacterium]
MIIPFFIPHAGCQHQCVFCSQKQITGSSGPPEPSTIAPMIEEYLASAESGDRTEVAFYGGSFTALAPDRQEAYLAPVSQFIEAGRISTIRISTRPDCVTASGISLLKRFRVTIVELGSQSMDDEVLHRSGRGHTAADTAATVALLGSEGFIIGIQIMAGLPGDRDETFLRTVEETVGLKPDFVRLYPTLVIKNTPLEELYRSGAYEPLSIDSAVDLCRQALLRFEEAGIPVIRIGLQPTAELGRPGTVLAGPYHPAFGQLVESSIFLGKMQRLLGKGSEHSSARITVHPLDLSTALGQKRSNVMALKTEYRLRSLSIAADENVPRKSVRLLTSL